MPPVSDENKPLTLQERIALKRRELDASGVKPLPSPVVRETTAKTEPVATEYAADIPDVPRHPDDAEMDQILDSVGIIEAYNRWCGKMVPQPKPGQYESIKISCPIPSHPDLEPSAWLNTREDVWHCGGCEIGGDKYDLAAYHFHYPVPGYKEGENFPKLRREMASSLGWTEQRFPGGITVMVPPVQEPVSTPAPVAPTTEGAPASTVVENVAPVQQIATVTNIDPLAELIEEDIDLEEEMLTNLPSLDWQSMFPADTFLDVYMQTTTRDDVPEEYHFWNALIALGLATGRDVVLFDSLPVYANLFVCTLGHSGSGKSKARYHMDTLLGLALPVDYNDPFSKGVEKIGSPGSAEALINAFTKVVPDPTDPKKVLMNAPVRGIVDFNELSSLVGRANRMGNILKPTLMQFYDMEKNVGTTSMTHGKKEASLPYASALTTTQPRALKELLSGGDVDSGFLNRWIFAAGPYKIRVPIGGATIDMTPCVDPLKTIHAWSSQLSLGGQYTIIWSEDAHAEFVRWFHEYLEPLRTNDDAGLLTRLDLTAKKLCLLLTLNLRNTVVSRESVLTMQQIIRYCVDCYSIGAEEIGNTIQNQIRSDILRVIENLTKKTASGASLRDISKYLKRKKYPLDQVVKTLEYMGKLDEIVAAKSTGVGRPTVRYTLATG